MQFFDFLHKIYRRRKNIINPLLSPLLSFQSYAIIKMDKEINNKKYKGYIYDVRYRRNFNKQSGIYINY